ncbi:MAG: O-antigen ligase family protein [Rhodoferax sp.]
MNHSEQISDKSVFAGLLFLLVWAPLPLGSNRTWAIGLLLLVVVVLLVGTVVAWRNRSAAALARLGTFRWPLGLLGMMMGLAWLQTMALPGAWVAALSPLTAAAQMPAEWMTLSLDVFQSRLMAVLSFLYFAVFVVALLTVRNARRLEIIAQVLVWSGVLQAVIGAVLFSMNAQYQLFFTNVSHGRLVGTYVNPNHAAGYLSMCLCVGIGLMLARLGGRQGHHVNWKSRLVAVIEFILSAKMRLRLLLVVMVIALVLTRSRMGNSAFFSAMLVVGLVAFVLARKTAPKMVALIASLVVIDVLVVGTWVGLERVVERIQDTELTTEAGGKAESVEARTEAARTALAIVRDFPLTGTGGGSFYNLFLSYRTPDYALSYVDHAHNDFVEIATDFGLPGLGLLGVLVALTVWKMLVVLARRRADLPRGMAFGVLMSMVALLVHSTVDFNLQIPANALTMVVIMAMGWVAVALPSARRRHAAAAADHSATDQAP